jgi:hypothetical protein
LAACNRKDTSGRPYPPMYKADIWTSDRFI